MSQCTGRRPSTVSRYLRNFRLEDVTARLPGDDADSHARFLEAVVSTAQGRRYVVASVYLP
jgi:hypothetical protein